MNAYTSGDISRFNDGITSRIDRPESGNHAVRIRSTDARGRTMSVYLSEADVRAIVNTTKGGVARTLYPGDNPVDSAPARSGGRDERALTEYERQNVPDPAPPTDLALREALVRIGIVVPEVPAPDPLQPLTDELDVLEQHLTSLGVRYIELTEKRDRLQQAASASEFPEWEA